MPTNEISLFPRRDLHATRCDDWFPPRPPQHGKCSLHFKGFLGIPSASKEMRQRALSLAKERTDIDQLILEVDMLFDEELRKDVGDLLERKDRSWSVRLLKVDEILGNMDIDELQSEDLLKNCLSVLRNVKTLSVFGYSLFLLRSLPKFEQVECIDLCCGRVDQDTLVELMDLPFARLMTGFGFYNTRPLEQPVFAKDAIHRLGALQLEIPGKSVPRTLSLIEAFPTLKSLQTLTVFGGINDDGNEDIASNMNTFDALLQWMEGPKCMLTELQISFLTDDNINPLPSMILEVFPDIPSLKTLHLSWFYFLSPDGVRILLHALKSCPSIEFVCLSNCRTDQRSTRQLLDFQLDCRPRLITIQMERTSTEADEEEWIAAEERFFRIAMLYQSLRNCRLQQFTTTTTTTNTTTRKQPIPLSVWPRVLEKISNSTAPSPSIAVQHAGIDALYGILPQLFSNSIGHWSVVEDKKRKRDEAH